MNAEVLTRCLASLDVLVLAGGLGTRTRAVLGDTPKLLAPIGGRPYLSYVFEWLKCFGAQHIVLGLGYRAEAIIDYLAVASPADLDIESVVEPEPLGTAGAIRFARTRLRTDPVLVVNGDSFIDADLCALLEKHRKARACGTLLCTEVLDATRYGRVVIDENGQVAGFIEKDPTFQGPALISAGVYLLSAALLDRIADGTMRSLEHEVFEQLPPGSLASLVGRYRFIDIGTPESLARAANVLARPAV